MLGVQLLLFEPQPFLGHPGEVRGVDGPPNVLGLPNPASSTNTSNTLGAPGGGCGWRIRFQSGAEPANVRLHAPPAGGNAESAKAKS